MLPEFLVPMLHMPASLSPLITMPSCLDTDLETMEVANVAQEDALLKLKTHVQNVAIAQDVIAQNVIASDGPIEDMEVSFAEQMELCNVITASSSPLITMPSCLVTDLETMEVTPIAQEDVIAQARNVANIADSILLSPVKTRSRRGPVNCAESWQEPPRLSRAQNRNWRAKNVKKPARAVKAPRTVLFVRFAKVKREQWEPGES